MKPLSLSKPPPSPLDPNPFANCEQSAPADGLARSNGWTKFKTGLIFTFTRVNLNLYLKGETGFLRDEYNCCGFCQFNSYTIVSSPATGTMTVLNPIHCLLILPQFVILNQTCTHPISRCVLLDWKEKFWILFIPFPSFNLAGAGQHCTMWSSWLTLIWRQLSNGLHRGRQRVDQTYGNKFLCNDDDLGVAFVNSCGNVGERVGYDIGN